MHSMSFGWVRPFLLLALLAACAVLPRPAAAMNTQDVFQRTVNSVVVVLGKDGGGRNTSLGTGFYVRDNLIATNHHVVQKAARVEVRQGQDQPVQATVRRVDKDNDLVLLEVAKAGAPLPLKLENPNVGEDVIAIGNPKGLERTVSPGIVSAVREDEKKRIRYQITAPISPGSSGGPILDAGGNVIGLATFYVVDGQNLNFAVPALYVDKLLGGSSQSAGGGSRSGKTLEVKEDPSGVITIK